MKFTNFVLAGFLLLGIAAAPSVFAEEYAIDKAHSSIAFSTTHLMVSKVPGQFTEYDGVINYDPQNLEASKIDMTVQVPSITTNNDKRDTHLKSPDFFDAAQFPTITFSSKKIMKNGDKYDITGDLTMKGVTKEVTFQAEIAGPVATPQGGNVIGITATGLINRQDFGIKWNKDLDNGGLMVSNDVAVNVSLEAHQK